MLKLPKLKCKRCGHTWTPRVDNPVVCPKCNSARWNVPRRPNEPGPKSKRKDKNQ